MADPQREFSLADLAPEPLIFNDSAFGGDGARHEVRTYTMFSPVELGTLRRLIAELSRNEQSANALLNDREVDEQAINQAGEQLLATYDMFLRLLMPTLPAERLQAIPFVGKQRIIGWWNSQNVAMQPGGGDRPLAPSAERPTARGKRSPSSATATPA
jgi:hypothetical protein